MLHITDYTLPPAGRAGRAINDSMPAHVAGMMIRGLNEAGKVIKGSKVLIMGLAYKENVADIRESPARGIVEGDFFTKNRVKTALRAGLQFLVAKQRQRQCGALSEHQRRWMV